ncbi:hypothetical protein QBC34DRAFT_397095 [Podospora aff. communis PSN243]|uniref:Pre-mRNA-splicing factor 38B n=1 Tax=Podospora aff. communis PSN243 TaxID=3040156 RepID=A0AAV9H040_9PEZI|nr:hypothetical protein QBC34DRAFT_397095 [Podospora aff. communis PSN243]
MPNNTILTDDYVAGVLAKEASEASIKYSSMGLEAFRSPKPANKAKPNTRFLGRIIKETTNHNAALLAKEAAEAQARLDNLTEAEEKRRRKLNPSSGDIRRHQLDNISSILLGRKRKRAGDENDGVPHPKDAASPVNKEQRSSRSDRGTRGSRHHGEKGGEDRNPDRPSHRDGDDGRRRSEARRHRDRSRSPDSEPRRHRHRSPLSDVDRSGRHRRRISTKDLGRSAGDLVQKDLLRRTRQGRLTTGDLLAGPAPDQKPHPERSGFSRHDTRTDKKDDSDPLEDFIGPAPPPKSPVRRRGRGVARGPFAMDSRFSGGYDPLSDTQAEPEDTGDWDEAVETFRDRQKWKQQGADRLRAAGFTEEDIKKWEKGGEKDIDDVRWAKAGEKREWDRGKEESP